MILTIHRGTIQIGGSCVELSANNSERIVLDVGMPLTQPDGRDWPAGTMGRPGHELRAEAILPDIDGFYTGSTPKFSALVLSHAHLDHHGLAHHVHPDIKIFASRGTIEMLKVSQLFVPETEVPKNIHELPGSDPVKIGCFSVSGIPVDHASPDSRALLVEADGQRVLYSGDLRAHGRQKNLFESLPVAVGRVDALVIEGTTVGQSRGSHGFPDEKEVEQRLYDLIKNSSDFVVVVASGQNVDRAISVYRAAIKAGRELVLDPYQAYVHLKLKDLCPEAPQFDWSGVRVKFIRYHVEKLRETGHWNLACKMSRAGKLTTEQIESNPEGYVILARSNAATAALLTRLIKRTRPTIVWSQWAGYLKKGGQVPSFCHTNGIKPILIHSGGHAHPDDLARLANRIRPKVVLPIHTEAATRFADLMENVHCINDGVPIDISKIIS